MSEKFKSVFSRLRAILEKHAGRFSVPDDTAHRYCLEGKIGPPTLQAWKGKVKRPLICVGCVEIVKSYVSYHLMGIYGNARLRDGLSKELRARMQGKTCFNFKTEDEVLFKELEQLTAQGLAAFQKAGFISEHESANE